MQTVQVERGIKLLDSPGIIFDRDSQDNHSLALRNVLKVADLADPVLVGELFPIQSCKLNDI
jgi:nuclear GTP-binding protein